MQSPVQPRTPYTSVGTPPTTPQRLDYPSRNSYFRSSSPQPSHRSPHSAARSLTRPADNEYPESPTSPIRRKLEPLSPHLRPPPPQPFNLTSPPRRRKAWWGSGNGSGGGSGSNNGRFGIGPGLPRVCSSPRRVIYLIAISLLLTVVVRTALLRRPTVTFKRIDKLGRRIGSGLGWVAAAAGGKSAVSNEDDENDGLCRFVSPVEAYRRDLARLRATYAPASANYTTGSTANLHAHAHQHTHHLYSPTGHLLVTNAPLSPHPIPHLLSLGEKRWEELLSRQSRSLGEAVREYMRRYGRRPPKGFDIWWEFAMNNSLVLPDEYDRINLDLAPFWALPKKEMQKRMDWVEEMNETFTIVVEDKEVLIEILDEGGLKWGGTWPRALDAASLIHSFAHILPDMRATFSIFDQPQIYLSWARRHSLIDLGLRGEHTEHLDEIDDAHVRLSRSCSPTSNYRTNENLHEGDDGKSFIYDSQESGDFCQNPYLIPLHGLTIEPHDPDSHPRPHTQLLPLFSLAKTSINSDILITPLDQFGQNPGYDIKWEDKKSSKLAWRGSPTGISVMTKDLPWRQSHRIRLHTFSNNQSTSPTSFLVPDFGQDLGDPGERELYDQLEAEEAAHHRYRVNAPLRFKTERTTVKDAHEYFFDMKLAGEPIQCSEEDGTCDDLRREIDWAGYQPSGKLNNHKFLLDIDGNGWSGRFRRLMSTSSVVIKTGIFTEWFQPHLIPWFHYVPAKLDFSDLTDIMAFFTGSPSHPDLGFDETAKALGRNGQCFVQRMFRMEDLQAYMMRLFLEYARLAAEEGVDMDFYYEDDVYDIEDELFGDTRNSSTKNATDAGESIPELVNRESAGGGLLSGLSGDGGAQDPLVVDPEDEGVVELAKRDEGVMEEVVGGKSRLKDDEDGAGVGQVILHEEEEVGDDE